MSPRQAYDNWGRPLCQSKNNNEGQTAHQRNTDADSDTDADADGGCLPAFKKYRDAVSYPPLISPRQTHLRVIPTRDQSRIIHVVINDSNELISLPINCQYMNG